MIQRLTQKPQLGPGDRGRRMTYDEFMAGDYQEGYRYELIDGELTVSPAPNMPHAMVVKWLTKALDRYGETHPRVITLVCGPARTFVPGKEIRTVPEPDVAVFHDVPTDVSEEDLDWRNFSPFLVAEVISPNNADKDEDRNVKLYLQIPSIKEYWLFDPRESSRHPSLRVHRRHGKQWRIIDIAPGGTYTTKLLPGFELVVDQTW